MHAAVRMTTVLLQVMLLVLCGQTPFTASIIAQHGGYAKLQGKGSGPQDYCRRVHLVEVSVRLCVHVNECVLPAGMWCMCGCRSGWVTCMVQHTHYVII